MSCCDEKFLVKFDNLQVVTDATLQDIEITENGTYAVDEGYDGFGKVTVSVPEKNPLDAVLSYEVPEVVQSDVTTLRSYALHGNYSVRIINLPNVTSVKSNSIQSCSNVREIYLPSLQGATFNLGSASGLKRADLGFVSEIPYLAIQGVGSLETLVLRKSDGLCGWKKGSLGGGSIMGYDLNKIYIYVPSALINEYEVATGWDVFAGRFRPLEEYTVDGTTTGEIDWSKVG